MSSEISDVSLLKRLAALPSLAKSRILLRDLDQPHANHGTQIARSSDRPLAWRHLGTGFDPRPLFVRHHDAIKRAMTWHARQGLLVMAIDEQGELRDQAWLTAGLDHTRALVIGRHEMCDLTLPDSSAELSLRHLAVLTRAISHDEVRVRVLDLRSLIGFSDESGRVLQSVSSEGSLFVRLGQVTLMMLVTSATDRMPDRAEDAYECIPERVFIEERAGLSGAPMPRRGVPALPFGASNSSVTSVRALDGPVALAGELCSMDEPAAGSLVIRAGGGSVRRRVSARALARGILVGRYERCDIGVLSHQSHRLSRVHLLIVRDGDDVVAVDTASTNGTRYGEQDLHMVVLGDGMRLELAEALEIAWHPAT